MSTKSVLSDKQVAANRQAIHSFIATRTAQYGRGAVILLPEFEETGTGEWTPVQGNGIRPTSTNSAFLRFGKMTLNQTTGKPQYIFTNHFGDNSEELANVLSILDPTATIGSRVNGVRLVIHESTVAFSRTNPASDIKWADQSANLQCLKLDSATGELVPIYRRTKVFFADDEGNYPFFKGDGTPEGDLKAAMKSAVNHLINHDNTEQLSGAAFLKFQQAGKGNSADIAKAARLAVLKGKATLTRAEKVELAELED